ncbi:MAG: NUDIX domain-containing protein [bacterium]|nr:NUDIX domain-containing protein [bacterium]
MPRILIVNEEDEVIGLKEKSELTSEDISRDTGLWVLDENDNILLAKRSANKKIHPNLWSGAVAGTVEEDETYESNIIKEAEEEIGLKNIKPIFLYKRLKTKDPRYKRMTGVFKIIINRETQLELEPMEVSEVKWFTKNEVQDLIETTPEIFSLNFPLFFSEFISYENKS